MTNKNNIEYGLFYVNKNGESHLYSTYKTFKLLAKALDSDKILWDTLDKHAVKITIVELNKEAKASHT